MVVPWAEAVLSEEHPQRAAHRWGEASPQPRMVQQHSVEAGVPHWEVAVPLSVEVVPLSVEVVPP